jgi:FkbM family methyltransferase
MTDFYSQEGQDSFLETCVFKGYKNGVFFDVGAHDGKSLNNTLYFEKVNGWTGVNIEPNKLRFDELLKNRPDCVNLDCAISNFNGETDFLNLVGYTEMLSGILSEYDPRHMHRIRMELAHHGGGARVERVPVRTIESICEEHNIPVIDYLSIDVEGAEFSVIKSINFDKVFIEVIVFENNYNDGNTTGIITYLEGKGYKRIDKQCLDVFMIHENSKFKV